MLVCDVPSAHVAALIGGTDFRIYPVARDDELIEGLVELAARFWTDHVLGRVPPPGDPDAREAALEALYPKNNGVILPRTPEAEHVYSRLRSIHAREAELKGEKTDAENAAKELLGEADEVDGLFSWKAHRGKIDWKKAALAAGVDEKGAELFRPPPHRVLQLKGKRQ
jgi:predicted phage-related endonuclease